MRFCSLAALCLAASGCTFEDGTGFATLESASLELELIPGEARDLGDKTVLSDRAYAVRLENARVVVTSVELKERVSSGGGAGGSFDPANPPAGYSLCHSGHCHSDDGGLVSYEEIEAELGGSSSSLVSVLTLPVEAPLDLWGSGPTPLERAEPSRELPRASVSRISVGAELLELSGHVSGGPEVGGIGSAPVPLTVTLPVGASFEKLFELTIDRDQPGEFSLAVRITATARLVDGIDFAALVSTGAIVLDDPEAPAALTLLESLLASDLGVTLGD